MSGAVCPGSFDPVTLGHTDVVARACRLVDRLIIGVGVHDAKAPGKPAAFCRGGNGRTVRTLRYRLTERTDGTVELYDHASDPLEYHSLAALPEHAATVKRLSGLLLAELGPLPPSKK